MTKKKMKVLVTGGCGFIGSNFINHILTSTEVPKGVGVANIDSQTYAGRGRNLEHLGLSNRPGYQFYLGDIADPTLVERVFKEFGPDVVFNFAAESHVDRSIDSGDPFLRSNVAGTKVLLDQSRRSKVKRFVQISTDEVYGSIAAGSFSEQDRLDPSSDYSASKAAAEHFVIAAHRTHGLPTLITRSANNFGPYQFPEKLLPKFITNLIDGKKVPLMWSDSNPGQNVRDWLHVDDNCRAIWYVSERGAVGEVYNIPGENERTNIDMTRILLNHFGLGEETIEKVPHRLGHDFRYSISGDKLTRLGFQYQHKDLEREVRGLCQWYQDNQNWWRSLKNE